MRHVERVTETSRGLSRVAVTAAHLFRCLFRLRRSTATSVRRNLPTRRRQSEAVSLYFKPKRVFLNPDQVLLSCLNMTSIVTVVPMLVILCCSCAFLCDRVERMSERGLNQNWKVPSFTGVWAPSFTSSWKAPRHEQTTTGINWTFPKPRDPRGGRRGAPSMAPRGQKASEATRLTARKGAAPLAEL